MSKMKIKFAVLAILFAFVKPSYSETSVLSIVGSKVLREGKNYRFSVSSSWLKNRLKVDFFFSGTSNDGTKVNMSIKNQQIGSNEVKTFTFKTSAIKPGIYSLSYKAYNPFNKITYSDAQVLKFIENLSSAIIKTDKEQYDKGDVVIINIFSIDFETKPLNLKNTSLIISDPMNVTLKNLSKIKFDYGKYEYSFKLPCSSPFGTYKINFMTSTGESYSKHFTVLDYKFLLKDDLFSLKVDFPQPVAFSEGSFPLTVSVFYQNGIPVKGQVSLEFRILTDGQYGGSDEYIIDWIHTRTVNIFGTTTLDINIANDLKLKSFDKFFLAYEIYVNATFISDITREKLRSSVTIPFVEFNQNIVFSGPFEYEANTTYEFDVFLRTLDGRIGSAGEDIEIYYSYETQNGYEESKQSYKTDSLGRVKAKFDIRSANISTEYNLFKFYVLSPIANNEYDTTIFIKENIIPTEEKKIVAVLSTDERSQPLPIRSIVTVTVFDDTKFCFYNILSELMLVASGSLQFVNKTARLDLVLRNPRMSASNVIFYIYSLDGSISSTTVYIQSGFFNSVKLQPISDKVSIGQKAQLRVTSCINSSVSIYGIDSRLLVEERKDDTYRYLHELYRSYDSEKQRWKSYKSFNLNGISYNVPKDILEFNKLDAFVLRANVSEVVSILNNRTKRHVISKRNVGDSDDFKPKEMPITRYHPHSFESILICNVKTDKKTENEYEGYANVSFQPPDILGSYVFTAISMNDEYGIGLSNKPVLSVHLPLFLMINLPKEIKRGEILKSNVSVYSFLEEKQFVKLLVTFNPKELNVFAFRNDQWIVGADTLAGNFTINPNDTFIFKLVFRPKVLGNIRFKVQIFSQSAGDSVIKSFKVVPEGIIQSVQHSVVIFKNDSASNFSASLRCNLPSYALPDTISVSATVGDLVGFTLNPETRFDRDSLFPNNIKIWEYGNYGYDYYFTPEIIANPYKQNGYEAAVHYASDIARLKYFQVTGQLTNTLKSNILKNTTIEYGRTYNYKRPDSSFGYIEVDYGIRNDDYEYSYYDIDYEETRTVKPGYFRRVPTQVTPDSSIFLTAFLVKALIWEKPFVLTDRTNLTKIFDFIVSQQKSDGSFNEVGKSVIGLTSYVTLVLLENLSNFPQYISNIEDALNFLKTNKPSRDIFDLILSSHALQLGIRADLVDQATFLKFYNNLLNQSTETGSLLYWKSVNYKTHAYALSMFLDTDFSKAIKLVTYLRENLKLFGSYLSEEEDVVAIEALARYIELIRVTAQPMEFLMAKPLDIHLRPNRGSSVSAIVTSENMLADQVFDLNPLTRQLTVSSGSGSVGFTRVTLTCQFNAINENLTIFNITHEFLTACKTLITSKICVSYNINRNLSVIATVSMFSGFTYDESNAQPSNIKVVATNRGGIVDVYFDIKSGNKTCFNIQSTRKNIVKNLVPAYIKIFNILLPDERDQMLYSVPSVLPPCNCTN